ncbi:MAG: hypothetical protein LBD93_03555 [Treponema sp.]|nr:hypothetical protein [Treponema sp.]
MGKKVRSEASTGHLLGRKRGVKSPRTHQVVREYRNKRDGKSRNGNRRRCRTLEGPGALQSRVLRGKKDVLEERKRIEKI